MANDPMLDRLLATMRNVRPGFRRCVGVRTKANRWLSFRYVAFCLWLSRRLERQAQRILDRITGDIEKELAESEARSP